MEILHTFGINWYLAFAQVVNFLIIFFLLKRFVYKPVFAMLKKREALARETITDNQKSKEALGNAEKERESVIKKARDDARQILDDARSEAHEIVEEANKKAKKQSDVTIKESLETVEREIRIAEQQLQKKLGTILERILKDSLQDMLTEKEQEDVMKKVLKRLPA